MKKLLLAMVFAGNFFAGCSQGDMSSEPATGASSTTTNSTGSAEGGTTTDTNSDSATK